MQVVSMHVAKSSLSQLVKRAATGETILLGAYGKVEAKLVPANIREGVTVLGVKGAMSGNEGMKPQTKTVTPTFEPQVVLPDTAHNCLSQVTVQAIPATYVDNAAGGQTLTIGG